MIILSEKERQIVLQIIRDANPREDTIGCLISRSNAYQLLGDKGVVELARKLETPVEEE